MFLQVPPDSPSPSLADGAPRYLDAPGPFFLNQQNKYRRYILLQVPLRLASLAGGWDTYVHACPHPTDDRHASSPLPVSPPSPLAKPKYINENLCVTERPFPAAADVQTAQTCGFPILAVVMEIEAHALHRGRKIHHAHPVHVHLWSPQM